MDANSGIAPPGYHKHFYSDRDWRAYSPLLAKIVQFSTHGPILDIGAGCGYLVEAATGWGMECIGLEGAEEALKMAKERSPRLDIRHHRLSKALPFPEEAFQTVVLNQVIEHLESDVQRRVLAEVYRILRPKGMLLITSPCRFNKHERQADPTHINLLSPVELNSMLIACRYENIISFNSPLLWFGSGRLGMAIMKVLFRLLEWDCMSATANAMAFKPR